LRKTQNKNLNQYCKMENIFIVAAIISLIFLIAKFIEMRFVDKESKPLKLLIRDTVLVYFSVVSGNFILEQLSPVMQKGGVTQVFTDNPEF
jgi:hypothetical protein